MLCSLKFRIKFKISSILSDTLVVCIGDVVYKLYKALYMYIQNTQSKAWLIMKTTARVWNFDLRIFSMGR